MNFIFSAKIIPLFEVIDEIYEPKHKMDTSGKYIMSVRKGKNGKERRFKVKEPKQNGKIVTLR